MQKNASNVTPKQKIILVIEMSTAKGKYCKAALLFLIFSLHTVISFACSFSNLFHNLHHAAQHKASAAAAHHQHTHESKSEHDDTQHSHEGGTSSGTQDDCCSKSVVEFDKVEKAVSKSITAPQIVVLKNDVASFAPFLSFTFSNSHATNQFRWRLAATIPDLRIVIQSFQI